MINIIYENEDLLVVYKPSFIPTAPLKTSTNETLFDRVVDKYPEIKNVRGKQEWEGGLIHRLDNSTCGLVLFAKNQLSYNFLINEQNNGKLEKQYRARVENYQKPLDGFPKYLGYDPLKEECLITSYFRPYGEKRKSVRPSVNPGGKAGDTIYATQTRPESKNSILCSLTKGYRHQIRCHLAWSGYPIIGDIRYGAKESNEFGLEATSLTFRNPKDGKYLNILI